MIEMSSYFSLFSVSYLISFHNSIWSVVQFFFLKSSNPRETTFRSFRIKVFREHWLMSNHISEILVESVFWEYLEDVSCLLFFLCGFFFFCINIFVKLDIMAWTWLQAIVILNGVGNRSLKRREIRNLGPENCNGLHTSWIENIKSLSTAPAYSPWWPNYLSFLLWFAFSFWKTIIVSGKKKFHYQQIHAFLMWYFSETLQGKSICLLFFFNFF